VCHLSARQGHQDHRYSRAPSIGSVHDGIPVHQEGLSRGLRYVEILTNLDELSPRGAFFVFLPLKISGSSGGPGRAVAFLPE
jgi:kynurenine formamidase